MDRAASVFRCSLPPAAGVGLRHPHVAAFLEERPAVGFLEVHSENYLGEGGPRRRALARLAERYPISFHGVGLSLGSAEGLDADHLDRLARLYRDFRPAAVSEHLAWSVVGGDYLNDLLPLPLTEESLALVAANIERAQAAFRRPLLLENPSSYLRFAASTIPEAEFLAALVHRTGCGLLLDVNNLYVSSRNNGWDEADYLAALPADAVAEIHLAGHARRALPDGGTLLIDDHGSAVPEPVWALYRRVLALTGAAPTLIEWDSRIPPLPDLLAEAAKASAFLDYADAA